MNTYKLDRDKFEQWLSRAQLFKGAPAGCYQLVDGRSLHVTERRADKDRALYWYTFQLGGVHRLDAERWTQSRISLRFKTDGMGSSEGLCDPVAAILIEESISVPLSHDRPGPIGGRVPLSWRMDSDSPARRELARTELVVFEAFAQKILEAVRDCMVPE